MAHLICLREPFGSQYYFYLFLMVMSVQKYNIRYGGLLIV